MESNNNRQQEIYKFRFAPKELQSVYQDMLGDCPINKVSQAFDQYVIENIEPVGWDGIWVQTPGLSVPVDEEGGRYMVRVTNVIKNLKASILILGQVTEDNFIIENDMNNDKEYEERIVSLRELYVIRDPGNLFHKTAFIIEVIRFFFRNLWFSWDLFDQNPNENFVVNRLMKRLDLLQDYENRDLSEHLMDCYDKVISKSIKISSKMKNLKNLQEFRDEQPRNFRLLLTETLQFKRLKLQMEDCKREMNIIEDSVLRTIYDTVIIPEPNAEDTNMEKTLHFVSLTDFNFETLSNRLRSLNDEAAMKMPIKLHNSLHKALRSSKSGDIIYLMSGTYTQSVTLIENDIEIRAIDPDVVISPSKEINYNFLLVNTTNKVKFSDLTILAENEVDRLITVNSGHLILENCTLDCNGLIKQPIEKLNYAQCTLTNTNVINEPID